MNVNTDQIEHILRTKYGWDRFPLDEDLEKSDPDKNVESTTEE
tara:strand:- start:80 stop:208 length:129 start_codon:yes stop_codon:yes gene_type:complete